MQTQDLDTFFPYLRYQFGRTTNKDYASTDNTYCKVVFTLTIFEKFGLKETYITYRNLLVGSNLPEEILYLQSIKYVYD